MEIRKAKPRDLEIIRRIHMKGARDEIKEQFSDFSAREFSEEMNKEDKELVRDFKKGIRKASNYWIIVTEKTKTIGFGNARVDEYNKSRGKICRIYIIEKYRLKGIGTEIGKELVKWLKEKKVKLIRSNLYMKNKLSMRVHRKLGFQSVAFGMMKRVN